MAKKRTLSSAKLKDNYSYSVEQVADLVGKEVSTVQRWMREEGLKRILGVRPYLIHSSDLKQFLDKRKYSRKKPCELNQCYCCKCQEPRIPLASSGKTQIMPNTSVMFQGICSVCNSKINKPIAAKLWSKTHPLVAFLSEATKAPNGGYTKPLKYQFQKEEQLCMNLTP